MIQDQLWLWVATLSLKFSYRFLVLRDNFVESVHVGEVGIPIIILLQQHLGISPYKNIKVCLRRQHLQ